MPFGDDLHQPDFEREMLLIERNGPPQIGNQFRSDQFWRAVLHAMDDPMADGLDRSELWLCLEPIEELPSWRRSGQIQLSARSASGGITAVEHGMPDT
jgi:hypothetical protein